MKRTSILLNALLFSVVPALIIVVQYFANVIILSGYKYLSPTEALLYEGILFIIAGALCLIGIGGAGVAEAAEAAAVAKTFPSGDETVGPSEIFREYRWKPKGSTRLGLILIITGVLMTLVHLLTF